MLLKVLTKYFVRGTEEKCAPRIAVVQDGATKERKIANHHTDNVRNMWKFKNIELLLLLLTPHLFCRMLLIVLTWLYYVLHTSVAARLMGDVALVC
jgi:hypothetical protein